MPDFGGQVAPSPPLASRPATRVQFGLGAVLQYSTTPSLRAAGSEDSLPRRRLGEGGRTTTRTACPTKLVVCRLQTRMASEVGRTKRLVRAHRSLLHSAHRFRQIGWLSRVADITLSSGFPPEEQDC